MQPQFEPQQSVARSRDALGSLIDDLAKAIAGMSTGDRAELRRGTPDDPGSPAFWKLAVTHLAPRGFVDLQDASLATLGRWVVILGALAELEGLHNPRARLGRTLAEAGYSELRLTRLLRAEGNQLLDAVRQAVHFLASKGAEVDVAEVARLVLSNSVRVRRAIASHYYAAQES